ncbi:Sm protein [Histomonas meleagridis]|uniref:Sm protein n=1 Tax=Histomonas meleagridis TaxID=135588 RepID=UPI00355AC4F2|nr:Sm protein [Histomonas meleagridis]KAH0804975.1 Sm protein [Histomonas meleagridis]
MADPKKKETALMFQALRTKFKDNINPEEYPGTMSLVYELDSPVYLLTTDNEPFVGELNSFDAFGGVVLSKVKSVIGNMTYGTCYFRSEQILFIGHINKDMEAELIQKYDTMDISPISPQ